MFYYYAYSNVGLVRKNNEDVFVCDKQVFVEKTVSGKTSERIFAVFDGLGGHPGGELAAFEAATYLVNNALAHNDEETLRELLFNMNSHNISVSEEKLNGGFTTVAGIYLSGNKVIVFNIGDSRVYAYRNDTYEQISHDDVFYARSDFHASGYRTYINHYIGKKALLLKDINVLPQQLDLTSDDLYLICSDGVSDLINEKEMLRLIRNNKDLKVLAKKINDVILSRGAHDNFTYILIKKA